MTASPWTRATVEALVPLASPSAADAMAAYMKQVAPFLGVAAPPRRRAQRQAWAALPAPSEAEVTLAVQGLWALPEREYHYAACDLIASATPRLSAAFVPDVVEGLLVDTPWWDTVDGLGTAAVTPLVARHPDLVPLMWSWLDSGDRWLIRAAVQHQRGLRDRTDVDRLLAMCDRVADDREFFIAKAVGWALRDVTSWHPDAVRSFVDEHPGLSAVARREALRGLARSARP